MPVTQADGTSQSPVVVPQDEGEMRRMVQDATRVANPNKRLNPRKVDLGIVARSLVVSGD